MAGTPLKPVQYLNFLALTLLREVCDQDPIAACATFGLTKSELDELRPHLSAEHLLAAVANSADESLVSLRPDIREILAGPPPYSAHCQRFGACNLPGVSGPPRPGSLRVWFPPCPALRSASAFSEMPSVCSGSVHAEAPCARSPV